MINEYADDEQLMIRLEESDKLRSWYFVRENRGEWGLGDVFRRRREAMEMRSSSEFSESEFDCARYWGALSISVTIKGCVDCKNLSTFLHVARNAITWSEWLDDYAEHSGRVIMTNIYELLYLIFGIGFVWSFSFCQLCIEMKIVHVCMSYIMLHVDHWLSYYWW